MELTEKERLLLLEKKKRICELTKQNLDIAKDSTKEVEIKKNFTEILSLINQIGSYSNSKNYNLNGFTNVMNVLFLTMNNEKLHDLWIASPIYTELLCNYSNAIRFDFAKEGLKIRFPDIKNLNIGNIINK